MLPRSPYRLKVTSTSTSHKTFELALDLLREARVIEVQQLVQARSAPHRVECEPQLDSLAHPPEGRERDAGEPATLDPRNVLLAHSGLAAEVGLRPAQPLSQGAHDSADAEVVHVPTVARDPLRAPYRRFNRSEASGGPV